MKTVKRKIFLISVLSIVLLIFPVLYPVIVNEGFAKEDIIIAPSEDRLSESVPVVQKDAAPWQLQFLPSNSAYLIDHERPVKGVAMGYFLPQKEINGVSLALIHAYNVKKSGFSMSMLEYSGDSTGLSVFLAGGIRHNRGVSMGVWNMTEHNHGVQLGYVNQEERNLLMEYDMKPDYKEKKFGVQAGIVNYSDSPGIQLGLWNTNPNSLIKHFPFFNICL